MKQRAIRIAAGVVSAATATAGSFMALPAPSALAASSPPSVTVGKWFHDPLSASSRRAEIAVPAKPVKYKGPVVHTRATFRTHEGSIAVPIPWAYGHTLVASEALVMTAPAFFFYSDDKLNKAAQRELLALKGPLSHVTAVTCEGYADYGPPPAGLYRLSVSRAEAACALIKRDQPSIETTSVGYGGTDPVVVGGKSYRSPQNRRVVIVITKSRST